MSASERGHKRANEDGLVRGAATSKKMTVVPTGSADRASTSGASAPARSLVVTPSEVSGVTVAVTQKERTPPLVVKDLTEQEYLQLAASAKNGAFSATFSFLAGNCTKVVCASRADYFKVRELLTSEKKEFYSFGFPEDKSFDVVLKGLRFGSPQQVEALLKEAGLAPALVRLASFVRPHWASKAFIVSFAKGTTTLQKLREVSELQLTRVYWERYQPAKKDVTQCYKCLRFGHGANNCAMAPRCRKCGGDHAVSQCAVELDNKLRCANCTQSHSPFNRNCSARAAFLQRRLGTPAKAPVKPAARFVPAPAPSTSQWEKKLPWVGQKQQQQKQLKQPVAQPAPVSTEHQACSCKCCWRHHQQTINVSPTSPQHLQKQQPKQKTPEQPQQQQKSSTQPKKQQQQKKQTQQQQPMKPQPTKKKTKKQQPLLLDQDIPAPEVHMDAQEVEETETLSRTPAQDNLDQLRASMEDHPDLSKDMALFASIVRLWSQFKRVVQQHPREQHLIMLVQLISDALPNGY